MLKSKSCFAFDLDGTITNQELLPMIASELGLQREMALLTHLTMTGLIPFEDSFRLRCAILKALPISTVQEVVASVTLDPDIEAFIKENRDRTFVVTGNLGVWVKPLIDRLGCAFMSSEAVVEGDRLVEISSVVHKGRALMDSRLKAFDRIVAIGDGFNDVSMFEVATIGVAYGGVHSPVHDLIEVSHYLVNEGKALCRLLNTL